MDHIDKRFTQEEAKLLGKIKGAKLLSIEAVLAAPPDNAWNTVRMHFEDFDIDLNNFLHEIVVDEMGTLEEFGLLSVSKANPDVLNIPEVGADTTIFHIDETVRGVSVINDVIEIFERGVLKATLEYPQAIVFKTDSGVIVLDKEVWFSEMIVVKRGESADDMIYDESVNWEDDLDEDPTTHFEFHTENQEL